MMAAARAQIDNWYTHHPPEGPAQVQVYAEIRSKAKELAVMFDACVPPVLMRAPRTTSCARR